MRIQVTSNETGVKEHFKIYMIFWAHLKNFREEQSIASKSKGCAQTMFGDKMWYDLLW